MTGEARWFNAFGEEVDLDNIDREYALNILSMYILNSGLRCAHSHESIKVDPLVEKLRDVILNGRKPTMRDRARAFAYNIRCVREGKSFRAPVR
jgi:hypothetical protein